ncbi:MAG: GGDEF domain-containing protein [Rhodospirillales bacterium]|nr:GGDEF domain-containing protein [Alphaproteobacteria bacterium]MBL6928793.1 GGDEF domain-containing protein [Rhodospirillales bacterium]
MLGNANRFVATLSALILAGFLATSLISFFVARDSLTDQISKTALPLTSDNIYSEIQRDLLRPIFISSLMAQDTFVRDWTLNGEKDPQQIIRYLKEIQDRYKTITSFFVSERTRMYYHADGAHRRVFEDNPRDAWYFRVRDIANDFEINVDFDEVNRDTVTVFINYKVFDYAGRYIGATGVGLAVTVVKELLESYRQRFERLVYFVDGEGNVTLHGTNFNRPANLRDRKGLADVAKQITQSPIHSVSYQNDGQTYLVHSRFVPEFQWYLIVEQDETLAGESIWLTLLANLAICLAITAVVVFIASFTIRSYRRRIEEMATTDKLTGLANRQLLDAMLDQNVKSMKRRGGPLSMVICDIDRFKGVNDLHGHLAGDAVLQNIAAIARRHVREADFLCRWGGEEFLILAPDCDAEQAHRLAERIRDSVETASVDYDGRKISVTASLGVAEIHVGETSDDLIKRADAALYVAKGAGRNCVMMAQ